MTVKVAPSILAADFANLSTEIIKLNDTSAEYIHLDVMDGNFVDNLTFGAGLIDSIRPYTKKIFDAHLMIQNPQDYLDDFITAGCDIITFHIEVNEQPEPMLEKIKDAGCKAGIALKPKTSIQEISHLYKYIDMILVMSVEPGHGGQKFMYNQLGKIQNISQKIRKEKYKIELSVDGGINPITSKLVINNGGEVLVAGSYIFKQKNYQTAINQLR